MKKITGIIAILALSVTLLASCKGKVFTSSSDSTKVDSTSVVDSTTAKIDTAKADTAAAQK